jgi:hypothetical protein
MKIRTLNELDDRIREDFTWRRHEIQFFDQQLAAASTTAARSLLRASVALLYAHWEGFVKNSCHFYLCYIASLRLETNKLSPEFAALSLRSILNKAIDTRSAALHIDMVIEFRDSNSSRSKVPTSRDAIQTKSNLSFPVLQNILLSIGVDSTIYEHASDLINQQLVDSRNKIAHGQNDYIERPEWQELRTAVLTIMESIGDEIVNNAAQKRYLATQP